MVSQEAVLLLKQLAAEGTVPWLSPDGADALDTAVGQRAFHDSFRGTLVTPGTPLSLIRAACDALLPVYAADRGAGHVSVPVGGATARDPEALVDAARMLHAAVRRPNVLMRLPMSAPGRAALVRLLAHAIGVHASMVLTTERYGQVLDAYVQGMERALAAGVRLHDVPVVVSFPVGLLDAEVGARLTRLGAAPGHPARATAGPAMARGMFRLREQRLAGGWWRVLRADGALPPRLLWTTGGAASVSRLVGWNTAHALSPAALEEAARRGGLSGDTLLGEHDRADSALAALRRLGVSLDEAAAAVEARELGRSRQ
ncbi:transaldolase family protein [Streptomyces beihaiensis]|uniref:Transaldolase n=1 Tax=Streptomyces beihaiensis TaxID=2984495 RepID=A0ABT3TQE0_9ACTN|nr:transaldolase family protein [Streptomyces beihaiensis]MCX3059253.1 hypothetical protein [Streptomyces beihaiensis]